MELLADRAMGIDTRKFPFCDKKVEINGRKIVIKIQE